MAFIHLKNIHKSFGNTTVLGDINIQIEKKDFVCFVGPSGCGKSTMLRIIAGLDNQNQGSIHIDGRDIGALPPAQRGIAMVFQSYALYPHLNVYKNMSLALTQNKTPKNEIERRITDAAKMLQLSDLLKRRPAELSGGQRQRVAIGRSVVRQPKVFLLDEPLSNLDAALRSEVRIKLAQLHQELNTTMIYVTHDQVEAMTLANKVVVLNQGKVEQIGSPLDIYFKPVNKFVAEFIGSPKMNMLNGVYDAGGIVWIGNTYQFNRTLPINDGDRLFVGVRTEHWHVCKENEHGIDVTVVLSERLGSETFIYLRSEDSGTITLKLPGTESFSVGTQLKVRPDDNMLHLFKLDGKLVTETFR